MILESEKVQEPIKPARFGSPEWWGEYTAYIKSSRWRNIRAIMVKLAKGKCEHCGIASSRLSCHHKNYDRFKNERMADLEVLCAACHETADKDRKHRLRVHSAVRMYYAGLASYMDKKYGYGWEMWADGEEEFDEWLERKRSEFE